MSTQMILIIAAVFGGSFLLMIPFLIMQKRRKTRGQELTKGNKDKAILHIYADSPVINGTSIKNMEYVRGENLQYTVPLNPGTYGIEAKYTATSVGVGKNINYKTPKPILSQIPFEAGNEYTLGIYFYSPQERYNYYNGDVGETIYSQTLDIRGDFIYTKAYIICYKENEIK